MASLDPPSSLPTDVPPRSVWRRKHQGAARPRCRPQAPRHVHRRYGRRLRVAPHGLRGGRQRHRREPCGPRHARHRDAQCRWFGHRHRQRPRHPHRHPQRGGGVGRRGHHDPAARGRKIRPEFLQGVGRPARRRRLGRQCALHLAEAQHLARRQGPRHGVFPWQRGLAAGRDGRRAEGGRAAQARHRGDVSALAQHLHDDRV